MHFLFPFLIVIIILSVMGKLPSAIKNFMGRLKSIDRSRPSSYKRESAFFSDHERSFFCLLEEALGPDYRIFVKVGIADLLKPVDNIWRLSAFYHIFGKHVDFVVCNAEDLSVIGVIELDDINHYLHSRQGRDSFVDNAFSSAGVSIAHFPAEAAYTLSSIREAIEQQFNIVIEDPSSAPSKPFISEKVRFICDYKRPEERKIPTAGT